MSLSSSFYSALSGLNTHSTAMQLIGDNLANLHTSGFKSSGVQFEDVLGMSLGTMGGGNNSTGVGSKVSTIDSNYVQGTLTTTGVETDVAVNGKGFFVVRAEGSDERFYTRAGHFNIDNQGYYVTASEDRVQGYLFDPTGANLLETLQDIQLDLGGMVSPQTTSSAEMVLNLDAGKDLSAFDIGDPGGTAQYSSGLKIYDALGEAHDLQIYFTKTADQTWEWDATIDGSDVIGGTPGTPVLFGNGALNFGIDGSLTTGMPVNFYTEAITYTNGIAASACTVDFTGTTQYGADSAIASLSQNGYAAGTLSGVTIATGGTIVGHYSNGQIKNIAQVVLADFPSYNGLERHGAQLFQASPNSGDPLFNKPASAGLGTLSSSMLEESNVDMAGEFVKMILTQRGYQANSKVISTTDEMLAQLLNLK